MIDINAKLMPFSHTPGTVCLIPGTHFAAQVYPAFIRFFDLSGFEKKLIKEIPLDVKGPLKDFTIVQNLERGFLTVFAKGLCYHILPNCEITYAKNPGIFQARPFERLSLGSHKSQDWDLIKRRHDPMEIFPLWHRLGSLMPNFKRTSHDGMFSLLDRCEEAILAHRPERIVSVFMNLFLCGFEGLFCPRLKDEDHHGIVDGFGKDLPLLLLAEGSSLIRKLFLMVETESISILPNLPPEFFAGRFLQIETHLGIFHLEWTKKMIRRVLFESRKDGILQLKFPSEIQDFRLREGASEKGKIIQVCDAIEIKSGTLYLLDRFQK